MSKEIFNKLQQAVIMGEPEDAVKIAKQALDKKVDPLKCINEGLMPGIEKVGELFSTGEYFLPELIIGADAMKAALDILEPALVGGQERDVVGRVVLGTVEGDLHEIGKNIVKLMLEAYGFEVKDLGYDVDPLAFIKEAETMKADFIGASALMSTTMPHQKEIIDLLKDKGLRDKYKVVIGGAPTTQQWAEEIGADMYCPDAGSAPRMMAERLEKE